MREGGNEGDRSYSSASYRLRARNAATFSHALAISSKRPLKLRAQSKGQNVSLSFSHSPTGGRLEPISKSFEEDHEAGELDEAEEVLAVVLPADEDAALPLDPGEEAFDEPTSHVTA